MRSLLRLAPLAFALLTGSASAQVAGICSAGKNCQVQTLRATKGVTSALTVPVVCVDLFPGSYSVGYGSAGTSTFSWAVYSGSGCMGSATAMFSQAIVSGVFQHNYSMYATTGFGTGAAGTGTAYASFPTCNAGATGRLLFDSTSNLWRYCDGSNWRILMYDSASGTGKVSPNFTGVCFGTCSGESTNFTGAYRPVNDTKSVTQVTCSWGTAGTGGSTGVVVRVYDHTGGAELCSCTLGACTTAANTPLTCACAGALGSSKDYTVQLKSTTDCAGNPANIVCNVE